jgi:hypothetical protein
VLGGSALRALGAMSALATGSPHSEQNLALE